MTALVVAEGAAILLIGLLVAGLLRSHAEILRALHELGAGREEPPEPAGPAGLPAPRVRDGVAPPRPAGAALPAAHDLTGVTPDDESAVVGVVAVRHRTLLAFLTSGCTTCAGFWTAFRQGRSGPARLPADTRLVIVTKGPGDESAAAVRRLAPPAATVVLSSAAWIDYEVPVAPYFVLVDGPGGRVVGEGAAATWPQVTDLLAAAVADAEPTGRRRDGESRADRELMAAGLFPGDPSLYPAPGDVPTRSGP
jgi:hypothetical protein